VEIAGERRIATLEDWLHREVIAMVAAALMLGAASTMASIFGS
jgi:hypothetical protein